MSCVALTLASICFSLVVQAFNRVGESPFVII